MPAFGHAYSDAEIAAVVRYVNSAFGRESPLVTGQSVENARSNK
jgi:mono/diheme cytochrome c family protein